MKNKINKEQWIAMFQELGLDEATMHRWHRLFENRHPEAHQSFLGDRTAAGYRWYRAREERRLRRICELRKAGLGLRDIRIMLGDSPGRRSDVITRRLAEIAKQIVSRHHQQRLLAALHRNLAKKSLSPLLDKKAWVEMLRLAGINRGAA